MSRFTMVMIHTGLNLTFPVVALIILYNMEAGVKTLRSKVIVLALVLCALLFGQIEIDWTEVPQDIGIQFVHNGAEDVTVNLGTQGGPQTWDFTSQPMGTQNTNSLIVPRLSTPYGDSFPTSNVVLEITQNSDTGYAYGQIEPTFGANLGFGSVGSVTTFFRFVPTDSYPLPLIHGATRTYHYGFSVILAPLTELRTDNYGFERIDAYGTVNIPYGAFECLRMCSFDTTISSLLINGVPVTVDTATHIIYDFLAEDYGLISHITSYPGETDTNFTQANFLERLTSFSTGIEENKIELIASTNLLISPNPASGMVEIRFMIHARSASQGEAGDPGYTIPDAAIQIYDAAGQLVKSFDLGSSIMDHESAISWYGDDDAARKLPGGVYFVKFRAGNFQETQKLLLIR